MKRLTKIVATIGPSSESEEMVERLIKTGVNVFRFNFKHNSIEWHDQMIQRVNSVAKANKTRVGTLIDLQGPEIRIRMLGEEIELEKGEVIDLGPRVYEKKVKGFSLSHPSVIAHLKDGQRVVADDGAFEFNVVKKGKYCYLMSQTTGVLKERKTLNIPGAEFPFPVLIDRDLDGLKLAKRQEVDYVALSFVRSADDLKELRKEMKKNGINAKVISKIEAQMALDNLDGIVDESDGVMVARGDLGVELSEYKVPYLQKRIIRACVEKGKFVITATQMLETMISSHRATRAEVSDVANATYDLTDAVMLSGETANGQFPTDAVRVMRETVEFNERKFPEDSRVRFGYEFQGVAAMMCDAAYNIYLDMEKAGENLGGFVVFSHTGATARLMSAYRPRLPIYVFCPTSQVAESLMVNYGTYPIVKGKKYKANMKVTHNQVLAGKNYLLEKGHVKRDEKLIVLHGDFWAVEGGTSTLKVVAA